MNIQNVRKNESSKKTVSVRLNLNDYNYIKKENIDLKLLIQESIKELKNSNTFKSI